MDDAALAAMSNAADVDGGSAPFYGDAHDADEVALARKRGAWWRVLRPRVLLLAIAPALAALLLVWIRDGRLLPVPAVSGVVSVALLAAGARLLDLYLEYARRSHVAGDELRTELLAATPLGSTHITPVVVLGLGLALLIAGVLAGIPVALAGGPWGIALGVVGVALAFLYSSTTYALKRWPFTDALVGLALGPGVMAVMVLAQGKRLSAAAGLIGVALGLLGVATLLMAHLADVQYDRLLGRKTLAVVAGERLVRAGYVVGVLTACALIVVAGLPEGAPHGALLALLGLPLLIVPLTSVVRARNDLALRGAVEPHLRAVAWVEVALLVGLLLNGVGLVLLNSPWLAS